jgi:hypothetical protein
VPVAPGPPHCPGASQDDKKFGGGQAGREALGRSCGGLTTKVHPPAAAAAAGRLPSTRPATASTNTVERCFSKLKQFRAVATRYDKRELIYQATLDAASIRV